MQLKLATILLIHIALCGDKPILPFAKALVGDDVRESLKKEFPFVVSIGITNRFLYADEKHFCTGALISDLHVLTAARCVENLKISKVQVNVGPGDLRTGRAFFSDKWITYDQWAEKKGITPRYDNNDMAIIKLTEAVNLEVVTPAKVWRGENEDLYGGKAMVAGWGYTIDEDRMPRVLQVADVMIPSNDECSESGWSVSIKQDSVDPIFMNNLCAKADPFVLTDTGDGGDPLIYEKDTVVGVSSGKYPTNGQLNLRLSKDDINRGRVNVFASTGWYYRFIDDCLEKY